MSDREDSPDWLRSFQAPPELLTLSSDSEPSGAKSPLSYERDQEEKESNDEISIKTFAELSKKTTTKKKAKIGGTGGGTPAKKRKTEKQKIQKIEDDENDGTEESSDKQMETAASAWAISSDSECDIDASVKDKEANGESSPQGSSGLMKEEKVDGDEILPKVVAGKKKSPKKQLKDETTKKKQKEQVKVEEGEVGETDVPEEEVPEKQVQNRVNSSRLPLILPDKVSLSKALVECEGDSIDLSGDVGAVGRIIIPETSGEHELLLDLKGTIYKTTIVPSRTFCVVSVGQSEAKIEAIMNDFIQLVPQSNVFDAETMVEGTLDGYSFDSDDEADKIITDAKGDQDENGEEKPDKKTKGKPEKKQVAAKKKGKAAGAKQPKKRKPQAAKKGKTKK